MKMSWGYKILFVYLAFVAGIVFLAIKSSMQKFELVQPNYYADELKYQSIIDATLRAKEIGGELTIKKEEGRLVIQLPSKLNNKKIKGKAHLYFAADISKDIIKDFEVVSGEFEMILDPGTKGNFTLKLDVENNGLRYYYEQKVFI